MESDHICGHQKRRKNFSYEGRPDTRERQKSNLGKGCHTVLQCRVLEGISRCARCYMVVKGVTRCCKVLQKVLKVLADYSLDFLSRETLNEEVVL